MEITCDEAQQRFVLKSSEFVSCLGYDVVHRHCLEFLCRYKKLGVSTESVGEILESEIGTTRQYQQYQALINLASNRNLGTWFDYDTPTKVRSVLEKYRKEGGRLRLFYGDTKSGVCWLEENDVLGEIGRSTGTMRIPLLIAEGEHGGPGILDSCIVRILDADTREDLYKQKNYHVPEMDIRSTEGIMASWHVDKPPKLLTEMGYTHGVWVREKDGGFDNHANFKSLGQAAQWIAFMAGECCEAPR